MSARELLINLFQLPQNEIIFQDYGCAFKKGVLKYGRMFVGESHICFYANILGMKTKIVLKMEDITIIEKSSLLGIIQNAIEIQTKDQKQFFFCSFTDRDQVYSLLYAIWKGQPVNFAPEKDQEESKIEGNLNDTVENAEVEVSFLQQDNNQIDDKQELMKATFPISVDKFFELFIGDEATYSFLDHRKFKQDYGPQTLSKWQIQEDGFTRDLNTVIRLVDVPFKDRSRLYKLQTYRKDGNNLIFCGMTKTLDIPYANYFQLEERWEVTPLENDPNRCQLRCFGWIVFLKSTYMKNIINSRAITDLKADYEIHMNGLRKTLENMNQKPTIPSEGKQHEYEESKLMTNEMILEKKGKKKSQVVIKKGVENNQGQFNSQRLHKLVVAGFLLLVLLIIIQLVVMVFLIKSTNQFESRMVLLDQFLKTQSQDVQMKNSEL